MDKLHNELLSEQTESKNLQQDFLCSNENLSRCPLLDYNYVASSEETINKAFDILFEEVMKIK